MVDRGIQGPADIVAGPDGALWFTNATGNSIGRITTAGAVTTFSDPSVSGPIGIAAGPDGALWFTNATGNSIGRITTAGAVTNFTDASIHDPQGIAAGPDGGLWFTNATGNSIGRITTAGVVTNFPTTGIPENITAGPDGALWFTEEGQDIGRITVGGAISHFTDPLIHNPFGIVAGPDGNLWFTDEDGSIVAGRGRPTDRVEPQLGGGPDHPQRGHRQALGRGRGVGLQPRRSRRRDHGRVRLVRLSVPGAGFEPTRHTKVTEGFKPSAPASYATRAGVWSVGRHRAWTWRSGVQPLRR